MIQDYDDYAGALREARARDRELWGNPDARKRGYTRFFHDMSSAAPRETPMDKRIAHIRGQIAFLRRLVKAKIAAGVGVYDSLSAAPNAPESWPTRESHLTLKLDEATVAQIRRGYETKREPYAVIGRRYGVASSTVRAVIRRITWKHVA